MNPTKRTPGEAETPQAAEKVEKADLFESAAEFYAKGVERLAEVQKKGIEYGARQGTELVAAWKKTVPFAPGLPGAFLLDVTANAFERFAETEKGVIDLIVEQTRAMANLARERTNSVSKVTQGVVAQVQQTMERSVAAQKKALDLSAAQNKATFDTAKQQFGLAGTPAEALADSLQRGVDTFVETQKELLDIAAKPFQAVH
jgi:hypothetical protein